MASYLSKRYLFVLGSEFYLVSVPDILYGRLRDFTMILNCVGTQALNYGAMHNFCVPIELWLLAWYYRPGYLWKAKIIRNLCISNNLKKLKKKKKKLLTFWVAVRGYVGCNSFYSGTRTPKMHAYVHKKQKIFSWCQVRFVKNKMLERYNSGTRVSLRCCSTFYRRHTYKYSRN